MALFKAPEGVTSVSVAGVNYAVKDGQIDTDDDIFYAIAPMGFVQSLPEPEPEPEPVAKKTTAKSSKTTADKE